MFNYKQKWQKFTNWKGWRWVYWAIVSVLIAIIASTFLDIFKLLTQGTKERIANGGLLTSDEVECCWDYASKNSALFNLSFLIIFYAASIVFSFTRKRNYFSKIFILTLLVFIAFATYILLMYLNLSYDN
jgi:hypothetical protein